MWRCLLFTFTDTRSSLSTFSNELSLQHSQDILVSWKGVQPASQPSLVNHKRDKPIFSATRKEVNCWEIIKPRTVCQSFLFTSFSMFTCHGEQHDQRVSGAGSGPGLEQCWPGSAEWFWRRSGEGIKLKSCSTLGRLYNCSVRLVDIAGNGFETHKVNCSPLWWILDFALYFEISLASASPRITLSKWRSAGGV